MKKFNLILAVIGSAFLLSAPAWSATATAVLKGTAPDSKITGTVTLMEEKGGLTVDAKVFNVPPGSHGFHIHAIGNCGDMGKAAGGHFNPDKSPHGLYPMDGPMKAMAGDMGNIVVGADGTGTFSVFMPGLTLKDGKYAVNGLSIILHEKVDDFSQPSGNAGGRIACGIIETDGQLASSPAARSTSMQKMAM
jgi:superoxide dismutase, Cu-Zn family